MKKTLLGIAFLTFGFAGLSQNLILNPDFEIGSVPTQLGQIANATYWSQPCTDAHMYTGPNGSGADLFDRNSSNPDVQVPVNIFTFGDVLDENDGDNRYAHIIQVEQTGAGPGGAAATKGERITGTLSETLQAGCYDLSFWTAVIPHDATVGTFGATNPLFPFDMDRQIIEVLLVNGNSCSGLLVYTTPNTPDDGIWHNNSVNFTLTSAQGGLYNSILFRIKDDGAADVNQFSIFLDQTSLVPANTTLTISGNTALCAGGITSLSAPAGYTNYLWSNGSTSQTIYTGAAGTYTVEAWNNGDVCHAVGSTTVTVHPNPLIKLPKTISVCAENFTELCGPLSTINYTYTYNWFYNNTVLQQYDLVSTNACYTPTQYGEYTLIVTNQYGCSSTRVINVVEGFGPNVVIDNVYYGCGAKSPKYVGLPGPFADALSYDWTYDDGSGPVSYSSPYGHQSLNLGDGIYCVTITWSDVNNPSLRGCTSTACFKVQECCAPNPEFSIQWTPGANTGTITVNNIPANTVNYTYEQFTLYKNCNNTGWVNAGLPTVIRTSNFNTPVVFNNLDKNCIYKVVHIVKSECLQMDYTYTGYAYGKLMVSIYPNPAIVAAPVTIEMTSLSEKSTVEISDVETGELIFTGVLEYDQPLTVAYDVFPRKRGEAGSLYSVKISNSKETITEKILVR